MIGRGHKKHEDDVLVSEYKKHGSAKKVADSLGMFHQSVHERLVRIGVQNSINVFTKEEYEILRSEYLTHCENRTLGLLAKRMGRTKQFICRKAKEIGLTNANKPLSARKKTIGKDGYCYVHGKRMWASDHEHRIKAEIAIGRPLGRDEVVHHVDGDRANNANNNLVIMTRGFHQWIHAKMREVEIRQA